MVWRKGIQAGGAAEYQTIPRVFMFGLTNQEARNLRSQFVTSSWGGARCSPMAFADQGINIPFLQRDARIIEKAT